MRDAGVRVERLEVMASSPSDSRNGLHTTPNNQQSFAASGIAKRVRSIGTRAPALGRSTGQIPQAGPSRQRLSVAHQDVISLHERGHHGNDAIG
jgi:hypothetical protein